MNDRKGNGFSITTQRPKMKRCQYPNCQQKVLSGYCFQHAKEVMIVSGYSTRNNTPPAIGQLKGNGYMSAGSVQGKEEFIIG